MNTIRKNFIYNSVYQLLVFAIPLITTPYISRVLGANNIGSYSYSYSIAQYYVIFIMLGLNNYGNRTIASVKDNPKELIEKFWSIYAMQLCLGLIVNSLYFLYCLFLADNPKAAFIMGLYVFSACFDINWFFFGIEKFKVTVIKNVFIKILTTILIFILVKDGEDIYKYSAIMVGGIILSQIVLWPYLGNVVSFYWPNWDEIKIHIKPNLVLFLTVIAVSLFKIMDKVMLGLLTNTEQVGFYELSERIISIPTAFVTSLGTVMLPRVTNMIANKVKGTTTMLYKSILLAMFLTSTMCFGIMSVSKTFVPLFYGEGYEVCVSLFLILLPSCLFFAFGNVIRTQFLLPNRMDKIYVISAFLGAGANIVINLILIPCYGAIGAAVGTLFAEAIVCMYQVFMVRSYINIRKYIKKSSPFIISGIIMFCVVFGITLSFENMFLRLVCEVGIGCVVYFVAFITQILFCKIICKKPILDFFA